MPSLAEITPYPLRFPVERLLVQIDGELMANVKCVTVCDDGKGIATLADGTEKFGVIELAIPWETVEGLRAARALLEGYHG